MVLAGSIYRATYCRAHQTRTDVGESVIQVRHNKHMRAHSMILAKLVFALPM